MKIDITLQDRDVFKTYNYSLNYSDLNYTFDMNNLIGYGNYITTITPVQNICYYFTVSLRVIPRKVDNVTVKLVYYFMVSCKSITDTIERSNGLLITNFTFDHSDKKYNIGSLNVFDNYPIVLQSSDFISSSIEITYKLTDTIVYG